ncbi:hypothetical protein E1B28_008359 [Marasmius oreades]|uniref:Nuclear pore complex protein NUP96 C-terminal domain-containing protein n=1 Tax=Marasmius oreades TaxID=181124 RepID=A0A9P7USB6_9AGAR|nr:uncharacterized protein E1B28_008359 [Marasmius oreades]KAG7091970.1 hypothetical protein E1B28_008359 [Marasmius oreades]
MAKFSAYLSDSDEDEQLEEDIPTKTDSSHEQRDVIEPDQLSAEEESSSSSDLQEDELRMRGREDSSSEHEDDEEEDDYEDREDDREEDRRVFTSRGDPTLTARARNVGVDPQRMHVMQTSLFRLPEEAAALKALSQPQASRALSLRSPTKKQQLSRKHSRDSEGDTFRLDARERASFAHDVDVPPLQRPSRKYTRVAVDSSSSIAADAEDGLVDAGLAFGRSFRVGWGPGGSLVHLGSLCNPWSSVPNTTSNTSIISLTKVPLLSTGNLDLSSPAAVLSSKLLQHHLSHSPITPDDSGVPFASPSPDALHFSSFASLFPLTDHSFAATLFRLGEALFDHLDMGIRQDVIDPAIRNRISLVARKARVSRWLEDTVLPVVEVELRSPSRSSSRNALALSQTFTLLTANQVSRACDMAADAGYIKLSTLVAQAGGDLEFKEDLKEQLSIWKEEKVDGLIEEGVRKIYGLLAGLLGRDEEGVVSGVDVLKGLDWKRVFGAFLWFAEPEDATVRDVFEAYNAMAFPREPGGKEVVRPIPWYIEKPPQASETQRWKTPAPPSPSSSFSLALPIPNVDAHFSLLQLHSNPSLSLSQSSLLRPRSFGPSPLDFALPWHFYIVLSRVLRARDFGDRGEAGLKNITANDEQDEESEPDLVEGHSPSADLLASSYAYQLEQLGMIQEATFVLLHLEGSFGRQKAIKDLLNRSAEKLDEWMTRGLVGSLKIPVNWIHEAKALHTLSRGAFHDAYELYLQAGMYNQAHDIAVLEIAPDGVIRRDLEMLKDIFERLTGAGGEAKGIEAWNLRGKLFLDYVTILTRLPILLDDLSLDNAVPDAVQLSEVEKLVQGIPKMIGLLPDALCRSVKVDGGKHAVALGEMTGALVRMRDRAEGVLGSAKGPTTQPPSLHLMQLSLMDDATKLHHLRASSSARFLKSISCIS